MEGDSHKEESRHAPPVPARLKVDLRALHGPDVEVPPEVDARLLNEARRRIRSRRPPFPKLRWVVAAAAAACALVVIGLLIMPTHRSAMESAPPIASKDIDGNGRVDILDAYHLARRIEGGTATGERWDLNGDGEVDRRDVDTVAMAAVELEQGEMP